MSEEVDRARIEQIARSWIGTPYHVHAEVRGHGVDCGRLLARVYEESGFGKVERRHVSHQFYMHSSEEVFLENVLQYVREIDEEAVKPGDVVLYKIGRCYSHGAIVVSPGWPLAIVHAHSRAGVVMRSHGLENELGRPQARPRFFSRW